MNYETLQTAPPEVLGEIAGGLTSWNERKRKLCVFFIRSEDAAKSGGLLHLLYYASSLSPRIS